MFTRCINEVYCTHLCNYIKPVIDNDFFSFKVQTYYYLLYYIIYYILLTLLKVAQSLKLKNLVAIEKQNKAVLLLMLSSLGRAAAYPARP